MRHRLADVILRATLLAVPLAGCPCPDPQTHDERTVSRAMFAAQIDACLASDDACEALCRAALELPLDSVVERCAIVAVSADSVSLSTTFSVPQQCIGGRRPDGFVEPRCAPARAGQWVAHGAMLEAASVTAFARLVRALEHHGAPPALIAQARRAIGDELLHARLTARLAAKLGAVVPPVVVEARGIPTLEALAHENAVEGEVGETFGALVASCQARAAADPDIRAVYATIAEDEARHAMLSQELAVWLEARLSRAARADVAEARRRAIAELIDAGSGLDRDERAVLGLPAPAALAIAARAVFTSP